MPAIEQDKVVSSAIVDAFTLAIVEVCQTLNHQRGGYRCRFKRSLLSLRIER